MDGAMPATPSIPRSSADPARCRSAYAPDPGGHGRADARARARMAVPIRTALLGLAGMVLIAGAAWGGATLIHDPLLAKGRSTGSATGTQMLATWLLYLGLGLALGWIRLGRHARAGRVNHAYMIRVDRHLDRAAADRAPCSARTSTAISRRATWRCTARPYGVGRRPAQRALRQRQHRLAEHALALRRCSCCWPRASVAITGDGLTSLISGVLLMRLVWPSASPCCGGRCRGCATSSRQLLIGCGWSGPTMLVVHLMRAHNDMLMIGLMAVGVVFCAGPQASRRHRLVALASR